ncbi:MAG: hypothetical protein EAX81_08475 [Candidatus Thorarchaeota archaeon]|nr:hypothetical protein [Candidatus Thorarchaeota archaeon]
MTIRVKQFRDVIHGNIIIPELLVDTVVDRSIFQRMRWINQTSATYFVYPSLQGSRFQHSLGAAHVIGLALDYLVTNTELHTEKRFNPDELHDLCFLLRAIRPWAQFGALTHDIGHNAFSHVFEESVHDLVYVLGQEVKGFKESGQKLHEDYTGIITSAMLGDESICTALRELFLKTTDALGISPREGSPAERILEFIKKCTKEELGRLVWHTVRNPRGSIIEIPKKLEDRKVRDLIENTNTIVCSLLSGPLDVDRADYILRDAYLSGMNVHFDLDRYAAVLVLIKGSDGKVRVGVLEKGVSLLESFMIARFHMHREVYGHKLSMVYNGILRRIMTLLMAKTAGDFKIDLPPLDMPLIVDRAGQQPTLDDIEPYFLKLTDVQILHRITEMYRSGVPNPLGILVKAFVERKHYRPEEANVPPKGIFLRYDTKRMVSGATSNYFEEYEEKVDQVMCPPKYIRVSEEREVLHCAKHKQDLIYWKHMFGTSSSDISQVPVYQKSGMVVKVDHITGLLPLLEASRSVSILLLVAKYAPSANFKPTDESWIAKLVETMTSITAGAA